MHMCIADITPAPKGRNSIRASPTNCHCQHTHVCCRMDHLLHPRIKGYKSCCSEHTHVRCKTNRIRATPKGLQGFGRPAPAGTHMLRVAEQTNSRLHPRSKVPRFGRPIVALSTHTHTRVLQNMSIQGCARGSRVTRFGRPRTHIVRAHVPCRIDQTRAAPTDRELQRFGRATADVSIHMCVAECINSGLHPRVKGYNGVADQLLQ